MTNTEHNRIIALREAMTNAEQIDLLIAIREDRLTKAQAEYLAARLAPRDTVYEARKMHDKWVVWCPATNNVVEF